MVYENRTENYFKTDRGFNYDDLFLNCTLFGIDIEVVVLLLTILMKLMEGLQITKLRMVLAKW